MKLSEKHIYFYFNQVYQFSNALPLYNQSGGYCIARDVKRYLQMKMYMPNLNATPGTHQFLSTPPAILRNPKNLQQLKGVIISLSNAILNTSDDCKKIFIGHGTGDKPYGDTAKILESYDYHFISGDKHLEKLKDSGLNIAEDKLIKIGNLRFDDYVNGHYDREKECDRLGIKDRSRQNVLYAPTWRWGNGTFKKYVQKFCQEITEQYNLIVRPHHHDRRYIPRTKAWARKNGLKHVYFSNPAALIKSDTMADFAVSDIMISDTSSILYEYLITEKPIIVAKNDYKNLHNMPREMDIMQHVPLYHGEESIVELIEKTLADENYRSTLKNILDSCFYFNDGKSTERALNFIKSLMQ